MGSDDRTFHSYQPSLYSIPRELRDDIFNLCLISQQKINVLNFTTTRSIPPQRLSLSPAILQTCRQFYHEAKEILYGLNTFYATVYMHPDHCPVETTGEVLGTANHTTVSFPNVLHQSQFKTTTIPSIKRLEIQLVFATTELIHLSYLDYLEQTTQLEDPFLSDVCRTFVEPQYLDLLILEIDQVPTDLECYKATGNSIGLATAYAEVTKTSLYVLFQRAIIAAQMSVLYLTIMIRGRTDGNGSEELLRPLCEDLDARLAGRRVSERLKVSQELPFRFRRSGQFALEG